LRARGRDFEVEYTSGPLDAVGLTQKAMRDGYDCIAAVGGDGTINEVLNGFYINRKKINQTTMFTAVPMGTASDLSRVISFRKGVEDICDLWKAASCISSDVAEATFKGWDGKETSRFFMNIADTGLGSETVMRVNRSSKLLGGFGSFLVGTVSTLIGFKNRNVSVYVDGREVYAGSSSLVAVANGKYFGGGMMIAPNAEINDGLFDVVILKDFNKMELICHLPLVYKGGHLGHSKVSVCRGREVVVHSTDQIFLEMDGESPGYSNVSFRLIPDDIRILI
jgi:YegS/Rv2252/BmrU family lipid kinase